MSWMVGLIGLPIESGLRDDLTRNHLASNIVLDQENIFVLANRQSPTFFCKHNGNHSQDYLIMVGSPFLIENDNYAPVDSAVLDGLVSLPSSEIHSRLVGQYSIVRSHSGSIHLFSDVNSLRSLYAVKHKNHIVFSSHLNFIADIVRGLRIDFKSFGSHWLAHNQLSANSLLVDVERICVTHVWNISIGDRSLASWNEAHNLQIEKVNFPGQEIASDKSQDPFSHINGFAKSYPGRIKLALSGGLDSRLLFALVNDQRQKNFETFVYGNTTDADVVLAKQISEEFNVPCSHIENLTMSDALKTGVLQRYGRDTFCTTPISACSHVANYHRVYRDEPETVILDGAFGEIGRAQFYRKVELFRLLSRIITVDTSVFAKALSFFRVDIFCADVVEEMRKGLTRDVIEFVEFTREAHRTRAEDMAGIKFRRTNFIGHNQTWIDQFGLNMMPFGQNPFVFGIFDIPTRRRRGSKYFKHVIKKYSKRYSTVPLAKGQHMYSFKQPQFILPFSFALKERKDSRGEKQTMPDLACSELREFTFDTIQSSETRCFAPYDMKKIDQLVEDFFDGKYELHSQVDWFLSFELWRSGNRLSS